MKKNIFLSVGFCFFLAFTNAQVGINTNTPDASAILDVTSTNKGVLVPRIALTSASMDLDGVAGQATGLMVYNTGTVLPQGLYFWNGTAWQTPAVYKNVTIVTGNRNTVDNAYIIQPSDYYVFIRITGTVPFNSTGITPSTTAPFLNPSYNIALPDPTTCAGRELYLINDSGATGTGNAEGNGGIIAYTNYPVFGKGRNSTGIYNSPYVSTDVYSSYALQYYYDKIKIVSDGIRWISINIDFV